MDAAESAFQELNFMSRIIIPEHVLEILQRSTIEGCLLKLPNERLDRPTYTAVNKTLEAAGGKWDRFKAGHVFPSDPTEILGLALASGSIVDEARAKKKERQAFMTPPLIALHVAEMAGVKAGRTVLEPSAGEGALALAAQYLGGDVWCVEKDEQAARTLIPSGFNVWIGDFLKTTLTDVGGKPFDRVVMNPPFTKGQDIAHVTHALNFLKPRGVLVAITGKGWTFHDTKRAADFRNLVARHGRILEELPEGTFRESGTDVATLLISLVRD